MIKRHLEDIIQSYLFKNKTVIVFGARQVGKTTLVNELIKKLNINTLLLNGDDADIRELFTNVSASKLRPVLGNYKLVVLDEAQRIPEAGMVVKIIHDNFKDIQLIVTGSSSLELADKIKEPMTGRKLEFFLYPLSFNEMRAHHGLLTEKRLLEHRLVFGSYPDIAVNPGRETRLLKALASDYLYKDILSLGQVKKPVLLEKILKALAMQVGNEVSYYELAQLLDSDKGTIEKYIDLLEKTYIIFRLQPYFSNIGKRLIKSPKLFFTDTGLLLALLNVNSRESLKNHYLLGGLFENFVISEFLKGINNSEKLAKLYFFRDSHGNEVDLVIDNGDIKIPVEIKSSTKTIF